MGDRSTFTAQTTDRNRSGLQNSKKGVKTFYIYINIIKTMKNLNNISTAKIGGGAGANVTGWIML